MSNLLIARLGLVSMAVAEIGYVYLYITHLYTLPKIGRFAACALLIVIAIAATLGPMLIWQSIVGIRRGGNKEPILAIILTHSISVGVIFYILWRRRSGL